MSNQKVRWEARKPQNVYGDIKYEEPTIIKARKQDNDEIIVTGEGKEILARHVFYVTPGHGMLISEMDKLDGELVLKRYVMRTLSGRPKLVRFIT